MPHVIKHGCWTPWYKKCVKSKICPSSLCLSKKFKINLGSVLLHSTSDYELFFKKGYILQASHRRLVNEADATCSIWFSRLTRSGIKYLICAQWVIAICCYHVHPPVVKTRDDIENCRL
jgi:hypothetical protein